MYSLSLSMYCHSSHGYIGSHDIFFEGVNHHMCFILSVVTCV